MHSATFLPLGLWQSIARYQASAALLRSWGCVGGKLYLGVCLCMDVQSCVCTTGRRCKCDVNVEAICVERLGFKREGQISGFGQNKDTLRTLGCDKSKKRGNSGSHRVPGFLQMLFMQKPPFLDKKTRLLKGLLQLACKLPNAYCTLIFPTPPPTQKHWHVASGY